MILLQNLTPLLFLFGSIGISVFLSWRLPRLMAALQEKTKHDWTVLYRNFGSSLHATILTYGGYTALYRANIPFAPLWVVQAVQTAMLLAWSGLMVYICWTRLSKESIWRGFTTALIAFIVLYAELVALRRVPDIASLPDYLVTLSPSSMALITLSVSLLAAAVVYGVVGNVLLGMVERSKNGVDNKVFEIVRLPVTATIVLIGAGGAVDQLMLSGFWTSLLGSALLTGGIAIWFSVLWRGTALVLEYLYSKKGPPEINSRALPLLQLVAKGVVGVTGVYCLMVSWGIDPTATIASAGIIGIAVAYASQDTLSSLLAGLAILSDAPYKLGDFLTLENGQRGRVTHIGFRSTRLVTPEEIEIIIPNSTMANAVIINMTGGPHRHARIDCCAGAAYGSDVERIREILYEVGQELDNVVKQGEGLEPKVHFMAMGASSLDFVLRIWLEEPQKLYDVQDQANSLIYKKFNAAGIEIPYSKQDVYLYPMSPISIEGKSKT
jgi:MscS family membrane protein